MTNNEAAKILGSLVNSRLGEDEKKSVDLAIAALDKQTPKSLIDVMVEQPRGGKYGRCPSCSTFLYKSFRGNGSKFCWKCGQALNWE